MPKYKQGYYIPKNPDKWILSEDSLSKGSIYMRSGWEYTFARWADDNRSVTSVASEPFPIKYFYPVDGKWHRYYIDFLITATGKDGKEKTTLIEIKPLAQTKPPRKTKKKTQKRFNEEMMEYIKNQCKWKAAIAFGKKNDMGFQILTEKELVRR